MITIPFSGAHFPWSWWHSTCLHPPGLLVPFSQELWGEEGRRSRTPLKYTARKLSCIWGEINNWMSQAFIFFSWKMICSLTSLANSIVWLGRRAPPFNSPEDSAPDHRVELEIQRQYMNANNQDLPGEIQNLCVDKEAAQEERDPSTTSISHCHCCLTVLLFFPSSASSSRPAPRTRPFSSSSLVFCLFLPFLPLSSARPWVCNRGGNRDCSARPFLCVLQAQERTGYLDTCGKHMPTS